MSSRKPMLLFFAGPNGSGKSTITPYFEIVGEYTNADEVVATTGIDNETAAHLVDEKRYAAIAQKRDFTFETVLSSSYKLDILKKAKEEGYFIKGVFVLTADPEINIARVGSRVQAGGHDVAADKIEKRYYKSLGNINELLRLCDILHVYDNTEQPVRIIRKHKKEFSLYPTRWWSQQKIEDLIG